MNRFIWKLENDLKIKRVRNLHNKCKVDNISIFNTYEEANQKRKTILKEKDKSFDWKETTPIFFKNKKISKMVKPYEYNIFQYELKFTGTKINIGVIIFNQKTNEIKYKFIDKKHMKKLISIFPNIKYSKNYISELKKSLKDIEEVVDLKTYILDYGKSYPLTCGFSAKQNYSLLEYTEQNEKKISIEKTLIKLYQNKIIDIFK